jgi:hypothetical protein
MKQPQHAVPRQAAVTPATPTTSATSATLTVGLQPASGPRMTLKKYIRDKCIDCCGGVRSEVAKCTARGCPLWPVRTGQNPNPRRRTEEQRLASVRAGQRLAALAKAKKTRLSGERRGSRAGRTPPHPPQLAEQKESALFS